MRVHDRKIIDDLRGVAAAPEHLSVDTVKAFSGYLGGKAMIKECRMVATVNGKEYAFPFTTIMPRARARAVLIYVRKAERLSADLPIEMIVDSGAALLIIEADDIGKNKHLEGAIYRGSRSKLKAAKSVAWCAERLVDFAVCATEFEALPITVVGGGDTCAALLAVGLSDDRVNKIILALPSLMDTTEGGVISQITCSISEEIQVEDIVVIESSVLIGGSPTERLLPKGAAKYIPVTARHLGYSVWQAILGNL